MHPCHFAVAAHHFENDDIADHEWNESAQIPERPGPFHSVKSIPRWCQLGFVGAVNLGHDGGQCIDGFWKSERPNVLVSPDLIGFGLCDP